jgi:CheY-like chemotaxis protein
MSHKLRTPLNAIIGYAELLHEDAVESGAASAARDLERILAAGRHLLGLINDVLDLSKIEAGRIDLHPETVSPFEIVQEVIASAQPLAAKNGNVIEAVLQLDGATMRSDAMRLRQCLYNLVSNACKFTSNGRVVIRADAIGAEGHRVLRVVVEDTGIGMSPAQSARLFQPFTQADASITREFGGTGLGLMLTRHMARSMGGDVDLQSTLGVGSVFTLTIADIPELAVAELPAQIGHAVPSGGRRVLVIDDEESARDLVIRALTPLGFTVTGAPTAVEGIRIAGAERQDLILLDVHLPDRSGWDLIASLRQLPTTGDTPVIVLSVDADRRTSLSLGAAEHLVKPIQREMLAATVLRLARGAPDASEAKESVTGLALRAGGADV